MRQSAAILLCLLATKAWTMQIRDESHRLVGGGDAAENIPYVAHITTKGVDDAALGICAGAIISPTMVLTTAFCMYHAKTAELKAGNVDPTAATQTVNSISIIRHPDFYKNSMENDIAIIIVSPPFEINTDVTVVKLPSSKAVAKDAMAGKNDITVYGWGSTDGSSTDATVLQMLTLPVGKQKDCAAALKKVSYFLPDSALCANATTTKTICTNDMGGPAIAYLNKKVATEISLVALSSQFVKCPTTADIPNLFTRVGFFNKWIESQGGPKAP